MKALEVGSKPFDMRERGSETDGKKNCNGTWYTVSIIEILAMIFPCENACILCANEADPHPFKKHSISDCPCTTCLGENKFLSCGNTIFQSKPLQFPCVNSNRKKKTEAEQHHVVSKFLICW